MKTIREIKFRVWDKESEYWIENFSISNCGEFIYLEDGFSRGILDVILEQYIGRRDINGKEIYEGDILNEDGELFVIEFHRGSFIAIGPDIYNGDEYCDSEVIGNIHENPELLDPVNS